ncbi:hypothetical protein Tco_1052594 [Tanacetum coccineum]
MDITTAVKNYFMELNELIELRDGAYENTRIYKERTKKWHNSRLRGDKDFKNGGKVLLFNSRLKLHPGFTIIDDDDMIKDVVLGMRFCKKYASCQRIMMKFALEDNCERIMEEE